MTGLEELLGSLVVLIGRESAEGVPDKVLQTEVVDETLVELRKNHEPRVKLLTQLTAYRLVVLLEPISQEVAAGVVFAQAAEEVEQILVTALVHDVIPSLLCLISA